MRRVKQRLYDLYFIYLLAQTVDCALLIMLQYVIYNIKIIPVYTFKILFVTVKY
ncbi:hypothetical protein CHU_3104 [Cytophaga hutchinsonii ATCC 33406]|uniref:Uncharacterized protein n=1 Tax=Cytophaga hutchinsonii (strain ATCC 33406 / DSM 1761 / CIP 103989 / NBRC 15051 / NCIMB 9469 / D465) TaxID=269798 RepID=A0A6N4SV22_CYTH3|nr:hypothetical protein CHU_3104 [Cytophaga hutchinsonii ATCC 33406]